jgi:hypothetical protein
MWTPSNIAFASSVRRICSMISAREDRVNASAGRLHQAIEVLLEPEDPSRVQAQAFPDRITALDDGVERADAGLVAVDQSAGDVDDQVAIAFVVALLHGALQASVGETRACHTGAGIAPSIA